MRVGLRRKSSPFHYENLPRSRYLYIHFKTQAILQFAKNNLTMSNRIYKYNVLRNCNGIVGCILSSLYIYILYRVPFHTTKAKLNARPLNDQQKLCFQLLRVCQPQQVQKHHMQSQLNSTLLPQFHHQYNKENLAVTGTQLSLVLGIVPVHWWRHTVLKYLHTHTHIPGTRT